MPQFEDGQFDIAQTLERIDHTRMDGAWMMHSFHPDADIKFEGFFLLRKSIKARKAFKSGV
jgi:hypothetical protein|tara:strand:- start:232 stop:414 length:183 start_codon:yes stop_codon:yes gene_type:complete